ncbi:MAG: ADP-dependent glucokinase/phosphofructokinase [Salinivirgaceae bacterium]|nr:ADP-dependent glucokinase/phosphofructokinase [Salinivirgaceae bacterium]
MLNEELKSTWLENYKTAPDQLKKMSEVNGLISAFNANIDAVIKVSGKKIEQLISKFNFNEKVILERAEKNIKTADDVFRGFVHCFKSGIAEEWLIQNVETFNWLNDHLGYDKMQMGGQGGIVANVMAVCNVSPVYVHGASIPKEQASLFLDLPNLQSVGNDGKLKKANEISRENNTPLIHWIIEFDKGDQMSINGETFTCPKSNRFIATYDPLNFRLQIDEDFAKAMSNPEIKNEYIILSGYQMLTETFSDGTKGTDRIEASKAIIKKWKENNQNAILHFEIASTQDKVIRKYLLDNLAKVSDSVGFNERELIDLLEVMGEVELTKACEEKTNSVNLFKGMQKVFEYSNCHRLQLHMFGLYVTLQKKGYKISPEQNRNGMQLAAVIAAAKAGTGAIDTHEVLLWAKDKEVSDIGLNELNELSNYLKDVFGPNSLSETGMFENNELEIIAIPTIIIDKPITLVGMGDTISSVSLVAAR